MPSSSTGTYLKKRKKNSTDFCNDMRAYNRKIRVFDLEGENCIYIRSCFRRTADGLARAVAENEPKKLPGNEKNLWLPCTLKYGFFQQAGRERRSTLRNRKYIFFNVETRNVCNSTKIIATILHKYFNS